jgi:hypothetical protein
MRIALLISGRATRYEVCLLPILEACKYDVDVFMSINAEDCDYYASMRIRLSKWLKGVYIQPFTIPDGFQTNFIDDHRHCYQLIDGQWLPRNQLSMYWNDRNAFQMACDYETEHKIQYDCFMRFRADIINTQLPSLQPIDQNEIKLYSIYPLCMFTSFGIHTRQIISSDWVWGNRKTMAIYCNTYDYVLNKNKERNGSYIFHFESNHTDCMVEHGVPIEYVHIRYNVDKHRKVFDTNWKRNEQGVYEDSRKVHIPGAHEYIHPTKVISLESIPVEAE